MLSTPLWTLVSIDVRDGNTIHCITVAIPGPVGGPNRLYRVTSLYFERVDSDGHGLVRRSDINRLCDAWEHSKTIQVDIKEPPT